MAEFDWANYDWGQGTPGLMARPKNDAMSMGLLAAGLGILANNRGNYGKLAPALGAGGLAGLSTYQNMLQQQRDNQMRDEQMARAAKLGDLQMRKGNLEIGQMETAAARQRRIQEEIAEEQRRQQQPAQEMPYSPTVAAAFGMPQQAPAPLESDRNAQYKRLMRMADIYERNGEVDPANKMRENAFKLMPNVKDTRTGLDKNGNPVTIIQYADGREEVSQFNPTPKMHYQQLGDKVLPINEYNPGASGVRAGSPLMMGQSPDSKASNALGWANNRLAQDRFKFDKENEDKPTFNAELGVFVKPPSKGGQFGSVIPVMGTDNKPIPVKEKSLTEYESKASGFGLRMQNADKTLKELQGKYSPLAIASKISAENIPLVGGLSGAAANVALSKEDQKAEQAQRDFINAALRLESGAVISPQEFVNAHKQYFPQPGDSAEVIAQKELNRSLAIEGFRNSAGRGGSKIPATFERPKNSASGTIRAQADAIISGGR